MPQMSVDAALDATALKGQDVIVVSPQMWGAIWVSKHWIAHELSKSNRVLFVEPPVWMGGFVRRPWAQLREFRRLPSMVRVSERLTVCRPRLWPAGLKKATVPQQIAATASRLGFAEPVLLNFGTNYEIATAVRPSVNVYYCVDPAFPRPGEEQHEERTCQNSDLIYAVSERYREQLSRYGSPAPIHVVPHGFQVARAKRVLADQSAGKPVELRRLGDRIAGFVGSIHDAYVDVQLVEHLSRARPHYQFVLIGPYRNNPLGVDISRQALRRLRALKNVHLLGPRHFEQLPRYTKFFRAALVLVNRDDFAATSHTDRRTHFKWLAYLSQGLPVVTPRVAELGRLEDLVLVSDDRESYLACLDRAMDEPHDAPVRRLRMEYAEEYSFERTLDRIAQPILELQSKRAGA